MLISYLGQTFGGFLITDTRATLNKQKLRSYMQFKGLNMPKKLGQYRWCRAPKVIISWFQGLIQISKWISKLNFLFEISYIGTRLSKSTIKKYFQSKSKGTHHHKVLTISEFKRIFDFSYETEGWLFWFLITLIWLLMLY